jgi:hypothetical protein
VPLWRSERRDFLPGLAVLDQASRTALPPASAAHSYWFPRVVAVGGRGFAVGGGGGGCLGGGGHIVGRGQWWRWRGLVAGRRRVARREGLSR